MRRCFSQGIQKGFTLIEIMIALLVGAFLLVGILQIFLSSRQTYQMQENLSRLQENGRFAMDMVARDIRMAGYWGCLKSVGVGNMDITGLNDNTANLDNIDNGTDTLTLRGAFAMPVPPNIAIPGVTCGNTVDTTNPYYTNFSSIVTYRINNSVLEKTDPTNANTFTELIEGVENMQVYYGADNNVDDSPDSYVPAGTVGLNMDKVVSIRMVLTVRTLDNNLAETADPVHGDRRIRRNFSSTITLRNRTP
jgi:type IV pilus assembly protein PilW